MQAVPLLSLALGGISALGQFSAARGQEDAARQQDIAAAQQEQAAQRQEQAAREAAALRERNAQLTEAEGREAARRTREASEREQGLSRARAAARGVTTEGTPGLYLAEQERVASDELDWLDYSTRTRVAAERAGGYYDYLTNQASADITRSGAASTRAAAKGTRTQAKQTRMGAWTTLGQSALGFGKANDWWQS